MRKERMKFDIISRFQIHVKCVVYMLALITRFMLNKIIYRVMYLVGIGIELNAISIGCFRPNSCLFDAIVQ